MKNSMLLIAAIATSVLLGACNRVSNKPTTTVEEIPLGVGQSGVTDNDSQKDIVRVAVASSDHTTLVAALKAAAYVDALSNAGPFTVFAPTNAAFEKLPAGTVDDLLKPKNKDKLRDILEYHVAVGVYKLDYLHDGQKINEVNLDDVVIGVKDGKYTVNGAKIIALCLHPTELFMLLMLFCYQNLKNREKNKFNESTRT